MLESTIEGGLRREARKRGVWAIKSEHLIPGFPDRLLFAPGGRYALVELKRPGGTRRLAQRIVRRWFRRLGIHVHTLYDPDEVQEFFRQWLD